MKIYKYLSIMILVFFVVCATAAYAADTALTINTITGKVFAKIYPATEWTDATIGQMLNAKDSVKTEADSMAILLFPDKSSISLRPKTEIQIEELIWDDVTQKVDVNMTAGELRTIIKKISKPSQFRIKTPTAICGARGTVFYIVADGDNTRVFVTEGSIDFTNIGTSDSFVVVEGMTSLSTATGVESPRELTGDERQAVLDAWAVVGEVRGEPGERGGAEEGDVNIDKGVTPENPAQENAVSRI